MKLRSRSPRTPVTRQQLEALSPERAGCLVDGRRPASQQALADLLRAVDPWALRDLLVEIAAADAFSWDAYSMLGRVCAEVATRPPRKRVLIGRQTFEPKHGTAARWDICDCGDCVEGKAKG